MPGELHLLALLPPTNVPEYFLFQQQGRLEGCDLDTKPRQVVVVRSHSDR